MIFTVKYIIFPIGRIEPLLYSLEKNHKTSKTVHNFSFSLHHMNKLYIERPVFSVVGLSFIIGVAVVFMRRWAWPKEIKTVKTDETSTRNNFTTTSLAEISIRDLHIENESEKLSNNADENETDWFVVENFNLESNSHCDSEIFQENLRDLFFMSKEDIVRTYNLHSKNVPIEDSTTGQTILVWFKDEACTLPVSPAFRERPDILDTFLDGVLLYNPEDSLDSYELPYAHLEDILGNHIVKITKKGKAVIWIDFHDLFENSQ